MQQPFSRFKKMPASGRKLRTGAHTLEEPRVYSVFQLPDLSTEGGLREMKPDGCSTEVAFLGNCDKITEMTKFQAAVHGVPALRILCGHDLFAALEPLKFAISVRIHWKCAMLQAGIGQISGRAEMDADSRAVGTNTAAHLALFVPSRIHH
jgi:hypothetical protein